MKELRNPESLRAALNGLEDSDAAVRTQAVGVVGYLKSEEALPALIAMTRDTDSGVRRAAVGALGFSRTARAVEALTEAFRERTIHRLQQLHLRRRRLLPRL